jgi:hypothetical protein
LYSPLGGVYLALVEKDANDQLMCTGLMICAKENKKYWLNFYERCKTLRGGRMDLNMISGYGKWLFREMSNFYDNELLCRYEKHIPHLAMGVRQGDPLSPTLLILFINMFLKAMETTAKPYMWSHSPNKLAAFLLAYADDIASYAENRDNHIIGAKIAA